VFDFAKEAFDQMALLINKPIALPLLGPMIARGNDGLDRLFMKRMDECRWLVRRSAQNQAGSPTRR
jgi:hypothetical protein